MARPGRPGRNRAAPSFRQLRRFHPGINSDKVFGTHTMLADSKLPLDEIAKLVGFADQSHFTRVFSRKLAPVPAPGAAFRPNRSVGELLQSSHPRPSRRSDE